jgi:hypothetical protein
MLFLGNNAGIPAVVQSFRYVAVRHTPCVIAHMETTTTRKQALRLLQEDLESLTQEQRSLQIRLYDRWSQAQWVKTYGSSGTVTSESLAAEIETMRARQLVLREAIRELKVRLRGLQASRRVVSAEKTVFADGSA